MTICRVCKMLELMKSLQAFARATDNTGKIDTTEDKETCEQAKNAGIDLTRQQKFSNECLEVYDSVEIKKLRGVCDDFHCVTSEALAVKSVEELGYRNLLLI